MSQPGSWEEAAALWQTSLHPGTTILTSGDALFQRDLDFSLRFCCVFCVERFSTDKTDDNYYDMETLLLETGRFSLFLLICTLTDRNNFGANFPKAGISGMSAGSCPGFALAGRWQEIPLISLSPFFPNKEAISLIPPSEDVQSDTPGGLTAPADRGPWENSCWKLVP